jgi:glycosyltransferase involved in cell wall biosynthesis
MRVSVIIPCYNAARFIAEALDSVIRQTHQDTVAIVVDNGSTDGTAEIAESVGPRVTVLRQGARSGPSAARNAALDVADGDAIAFLDADDRWHPEKIARQVALLAAHPTCGVVHTAVRHIDAEGREIDRPGGAIPWRMAQGECLGDLLAHNTITTSTVLVRRETLGAERFPVDLFAGEDWDLWLRLATRTLVGYLAEPLTDYRVHDQNTTRSLELVLGGRLAVTERVLARGLAPRHRRTAMRHRKGVLAGLGHLTYERGNLPQARALYREAGTCIDALGVARYVATVVPAPVWAPLRWCWNRLRAADSGLRA